MKTDSPIRTFNHQDQDVLTPKSELAEDHHKALLMLLQRSESSLKDRELTLDEACNPFL